MDGEILGGKTAVDESMLTGESFPVEKSGRGIECRFNDHLLRAGNLALVAEDNIPDNIRAKGQELSSQGKSLVFISLDHQVKGVIALEDQIKPEAKDAIEQLYTAGIQTSLFGMLQNPYVILVQPVNN